MTLLTGDTLTVNGDNPGASKTITIGTAATIAALTIDGTTDIEFTGQKLTGNSPDTLTINGNVTLAENATAFFEIGGTGPGEYDQLVFRAEAGTATLTLGGTLELVSYNNYTGAEGDAFQLFDLVSGATPHRHLCEHQRFHPGRRPGVGLLDALHERRGEHHRERGARARRVGGVGRAGVAGLGHVAASPHLHPSPPPPRLSRRSGGEGGGVDTTSGYPPLTRDGKKTACSACGDPGTFPLALVKSRPVTALDHVWSGLRRIGTVPSAKRCGISPPRPRMARNFQTFPQIMLTTSKPTPCQPSPNPRSSPASKRTTRTPVPPKSRSRC
ncbi:MAG: hypothetical protein LBK99_00210 [Opitutaceae bacterium]|nr:hypothetical protein [Opitutaceae bacterium]